MKYSDIKNEADARFQYRAFSERERIQRKSFIEGAKWCNDKVVEDAINFIDDFFGRGFTVDDWLRDDPNLYQGRIQFIKTMRDQ